MGNIRGFGTSLRSIRRAIERHRNLPNARARRLGILRAEAARETRKLYTERQGIIQQKRAERHAREIAGKIVPVAQEGRMRRAFRAVAARFLRGT